MNNWRICWFLRIFLMGILIFKELTARRLYKSLGVKGLIFEMQMKPKCSKWPVRVGEM
jgi:hypothetical protein